MTPRPPLTTRLWHGLPMAVLIVIMSLVTIVALVLPFVREADAWVPPGADARP